jgi:hypothetical protein
LRWYLKGEGEGERGGRIKCLLQLKNLWDYEVESQLENLWDCEVEGISLGGWGIPKIRGLRECSESEPCIWGMSEVVGCPYRIHPILWTSCMNHIHCLVSVLPLCRLALFMSTFYFVLPSSTCGSLGNPLTYLLVLLLQTWIVNSRTPSIALDPPRLKHVPYFASNAYFLHMKSSPNNNNNKNYVMNHSTLPSSTWMFLHPFPSNYKVNKSLGF